MNKNLFSLENKNILISGASSGIGKACVKHFVDQGAKVLMLGRNEERLHSLQKELPSGSSDYQILDLEKSESNSEVIRNFVERHGKISGFLHSAGVESTIPLRVMNEKHLMQHFQLNVNAGFLLAKEVVKPKNAAEAQSLVFIASVMGMVGEVGKVAYCSSKGALTNGVKALALELSSKGIRANSLSPAMVETEMAQRMFDKMTEEQKLQLNQKHPLGIGTPEDIAMAAQYLLSDASRWVTGSNLVIDGGYTAQ